MNFQKLSLALIAVFFGTVLFAQTEFKGLNYKIAYSTYTLLNTDANPIAGTSETKMPCLQIVAGKQIYSCLRIGPLYWRRDY